MHHSPQTTSDRWSERAVPGNLEIGAAIEPKLLRGARFFLCRLLG